MDIYSFKQIIQLDFKWCNNTFLPLTSKEIYQVMQKYLAKYLRFYIQHRFKQFEENIYNKQPVNKIII